MVIYCLRVYKNSHQWKLITAAKYVKVSRRFSPTSRLHAVHMQSGSWGPLSAFLSMGIGFTDKSHVKNQPHQLTIVLDLTLIFNGLLTLDLKKSKPTMHRRLDEHKIGRSV